MFCLIQNIFIAPATQHGCHAKPPLYCICCSYSLTAAERWLVQLAPSLTDRSRRTTKSLRKRTCRVAVIRVVYHKALKRNMERLLNVLLIRVALRGTVINDVLTCSSPKWWPSYRSYRWPQYWMPDTALYTRRSLCVREDELSNLVLLFRVPSREMTDVQCNVCKAWCEICEVRCQYLAWTLWCSVMYYECMDGWCVMCVRGDGRIMNSEHCVMQNVC